jgi:hypothetical protein
VSPCISSWAHKVRSLTLGVEAIVSLLDIAISSFRSTVSQVAQHLGQGHFRVSRLESALHRGLDPALSLRVAHALGEEIGIATKVLVRRKRDRINPLLDRDMAGGREPGDRV